MHAPRSSRRAFTLIELLVVIAIIAILISLLLPAVQKVRDAAAKSSCSNNLKQLGLALQSYHGDHKQFPIGATPITQGLSLHVMLLPYVEQENLFKRFDRNQRFDWGNNRALVRDPNGKLNVLMCPSGTEERADDQFADYTTHYYGIMGPTGINPSTGTTYKENTAGGHGGWSGHGIFTWGLTRKMGNITDGTSNTFAFGEISWGDRNGKVTRYRAWSRGGQVNQYMAPAKNVVQPINSDYTALFNDMSFGSNHTGGAQFALCDGSVRFVSETIDYNTYLAAASMDGGETNSLD